MPRERKFSKDLLHEEYVLNNKTMIQIANENNTSIACVSVWIKKYGFRKKIEDSYIGIKYGLLVPIKKTDKKYKSHTIFDCNCDCGNTVEVRSDLLKSGSKISCGCVKNKQDIKIFLPEESQKYSIKKRCKKFLNKKFYHLTPFRVYGISGKTLLYECKCSCGKIVVRRDSNIGKNTTSCGCQRPHGKTSYKWTGCGELSGTYWAAVVARSKKKKIELSINIDDAWNQYLKQDKKCAISGVNLYFSDSSLKNEKTTASLDRIDSSLGYINGNIQWVHKDINVMKMNLSQEKFIKWCKIITENNQCLN